MILLLCLFIVFQSAPAQGPPVLSFKQFAKHYLEKSSDAIQAKSQWIDAKNQAVQQTDLWKSRLEATPTLSFQSQVFDSALRPDNNNRTSQVEGTFTQEMPSGTQLQLSGQKYIEPLNPLFSALDRRYSVKLTQDLFRNAFGEAQRTQKKRAHLDLEASRLEARKSIVDACEKAFQLYTDTYRQQEELKLLTEQMVDAEKAYKISKRLFRSKLINSIDKLSSESDFMDRKLEYKRAQLQFENNKRQIAIFIGQAKNLSLTTPEDFLKKFDSNSSRGRQTLNEKLLSQQLQSQELEIDRLASDRRTDVQLGLEAGETIGRFGFAGSIVGYNEQSLTASLKLGFDLVNNTENSALRTAVDKKNNLSIAKAFTADSQMIRVANIEQLVELLRAQIQSHQAQSKLLNKKMNLAFKRMQRAQIDFENYLLHRNAFLNQKQKLFQIQVDYWRNLFTLKKEYAHLYPQFCEMPL